MCSRKSDTSLNSSSRYIIITMAENLSWHVDWQRREFPNHSEVTVGDASQTGFHRADVLDSKSMRTVELQHSNMTGPEVLARTKYYRAQGYEVNWLLDGANVNICTRNGQEGINFNGAGIQWYKRFTGSCDKCAGVGDTHMHVFIHVPQHDDAIYAFYPCDVALKFVFPTMRISRRQFVDYIHGRLQLDMCGVLHRPVWTVTQMGPGNGKTYSATLSFLESDYMYGIFVAKQHSAKGPVTKHFEMHLSNRGSHHVNGMDSFQRYDIDHKGIISVDRYWIDTSDSKKTVITVQTVNDGTNDMKRIVVCTVDAFFMSLGTPLDSARDMFESCARQIALDGPKKITGTGRTRVVRPMFKLHHSSLICIDEAQMLPPIHVDTIHRLMRDTRADVNSIGDKLQSISLEENMQTCMLDPERVLPGISINRLPATNVIWRHNSPRILMYQNGLVDYAKYGLPFASLAPGRGPGRVEESDAVHLIFRRNLTDQQVIAAISTEVCRLSQKYGFAPDDIMCVSTFVGDKALNRPGNKYVEELSPAIQKMWSNNLRRAGFRLGLVDTKWHGYSVDNAKKLTVFRHKAEEGHPINFDESIGQTRIVSVHAAQGNQSPVQIAALLSFQRVGFRTPGELCPESKMLVGVTRPQEVLILVVEDDPKIYSRLRAIPDPILQHQLDVLYTTELSFESPFTESYVKTLEIFQRSYSLALVGENMMLYDTVLKTCAASPDKRAKEDSVDTTFQDMKRPVKYWSMMMAFMERDRERDHRKLKRKLDASRGIDPVSDPDDDITAQCITQIKSLRKRRVFIVPSKDFYNLRRESANAKKDTDKMILIIDDSGKQLRQQSQIIKAICEHVLSRLSTQLEWSTVCPIEAYCICYMLNPYADAYDMHALVERIMRDCTYYDHSNAYMCKCSVLFGATTSLEPSQGKVVTRPWVISDYMTSITNAVGVQVKLVMERFGGNMNVRHRAHFKLSSANNDEVSVGADLVFSAYNATDAVLIYGHHLEHNAMNHYVDIYRATMDAFVVANSMGGSQTVKQFRGKRLSFAVIGDSPEMPYIHTFDMDLFDIHESVFRKTIRDDLFYQLGTGNTINAFVHWCASLRQTYGSDAKTVYKKYREQVAVADTTILSNKRFMVCACNFFDDTSQMVDELQRRLVKEVENICDAVVARSDM